MSGSRKRGASPTFHVGVIMERNEVYEVFAQNNLGHFDGFITHLGDFYLTLPSCTNIKELMDIAEQRIKENA